MHACCLGEITEFGHLLSRQWNREWNLWFETRRVFCDTHFLDVRVVWLSKKTQNALFQTFEVANTDCFCSYSNHIWSRTQWASGGKRKTWESIIDLWFHTVRMGTLCFYARSQLFIIEINTAVKAAPNQIKQLLNWHPPPPSIDMISSRLLATFLSALFFSLTFQTGLQP